MIRRLMLTTVIAILPLAATAALPRTAIAGDARRDAILADYAAKAGTASFSAQRGETLFRTKSTGGDPRTSSCTACHTSDPRQPGQNAKTGRPIEPVAMSVNPRRFTDPATVEKQFTRDCRSVLGRDCTPLEKGDYITFLAGQ
jgi:mono/diheme cytochrome c family protein